MKKLISMLLVAVMLCMGLSSCGKEAALSFQSQRTTREQYEWFMENKISFYATLNVINGEIPTAEKVPVEWAFPISLYLGVQEHSVRDSCFFTIEANGFKIDTSLGAAQENQYKHTFYAYNRDKESALYVTYDDIYDNNISYHVDLFLTYLGYEDTTGVIALELLTDDAKGSKGVDFYYATDGEYIAYSVKSVEAAQDALLKD